MSYPVFQLHDEFIAFPHPALASPEGLLAIEGDLSPERILLAYLYGIFPWYNPGDPIYWWSPDPRMVLFPSDLKVHKSMRPYFNQEKYRVSFDEDFEAVIRCCKESGDRFNKGTWITDEMEDAYIELHQSGLAHSVEVWDGKVLVGGLYGLALGKVFYGESMFAKKSNASKFGFISLVQKLEKMGFWLIDCQQETPHLKSLGAKPILRSEFLEILQKNRLEYLKGYSADFANHIQQV
ncbi:MAG: leucyl/phenylalanyl-tRNA--protein transferase [Saprospiraceae bacterium]|nr:leucyl/phenylalanyl-tRNA--protein transferase [Saprospiraceae bacterium]